MGIEYVFQPPDGHDTPEFWVACLAFLDGRGLHVVSAVVHRDQERPHMHAIVLAVEGGRFAGATLTSGTNRLYAQRIAFMAHVRARLGLRPDRRSGPSVMERLALSTGKGPRRHDEAERRDQALLRRAASADRPHGPGPHIALHLRSSRVGRAPAYGGCAEVVISARVPSARVPSACVGAAGFERLPLPTRVALATWTWRDVFDEGIAGGSSPGAGLDAVASAYACAQGGSSATPGRLMAVLARRRIVLPGGNIATLTRAADLAEAADAALPGIGHATSRVPDDDAAGRGWKFFHSVSFVSAHNLFCLLTTTRSSAPRIRRTLGLGAPRHARGQPESSPERRRCRSQRQRRGSLGPSRRTPALLACAPVLEGLGGKPQARRREKAAPWCLTDRSGCLEPNCRALGMASGRMQEFCPALCRAPSVACFGQGAPRPATSGMATALQPESRRGPGWC